MHGASEVSIEKENTGSWQPTSPDKEKFLKLMSKLFFPSHSTLYRGLFLPQKRKRKKISKRTGNWKNMYR